MVEFLISKGIRVKSKKNSLLMKFLNKLLFFNTNFMDYTTTIGNTIYTDNYKGDVLCHEYIHIYDYSNKGKIKYFLMYLFPQILALFALLSFFSLWFLLFLIFLLPIPSPTRTKIELRGYAGNILYWRSQKLVPSEEYYYWISKQFSSFAYYKMWPWMSVKMLKKELNSILDFDIYTEPFKELSDHLKLA